MITRRIVTTFATLVALAAPVAAHAQTKTDKPVTPEQVAKNTESESKRVANRTGKTVRKAGKQTEKQAKRTAKSIKKVYSRKARRDTAVLTPGWVPSERQVTYVTGLA
ncbi:hypothetical protein [Roseisolibacter agri]|uniref:Uncharacterized protein n=1 Tax=Roseisolibacter agri TaxID=2014610 RepID=A0AA37V2Q9_9BACT|nr:hypothetical protein [Roseisolibacter agri]GLC25587.1 hypothetical protein rosag_21000 [Roseisolibacter agri]